MRTRAIDPGGVLIVDTDSDAPDELREALTDGRADTVSVVDSVSAVGAAVDSAPGLGCLVVRDVGHVTPCLDAVRTIDEQLPVVAFVPSDARVATAVAGDGNARYVPSSADLETLRSIVDDARDAYATRTRHAEQSELFETLCEDTGITVFVLDEEGRYCYRTPADLWPHAGDPIGKTPIEFMDDVFHERATQAHRENRHVIESGDPLRCQDVCYRTEDREFWVETIKVPWYDGDGEIRGLVGLAVDVTERKHDQLELRQHRERVDRFAKYITHDLRTPLQIAFGALNRVRRGDEDAIEKIEAAHDHMESIVADLGVLSNASVRPAGSERETGTPSTRLVPLVREIWPLVAGDDATLQVDVPEGATLIAEPDVIHLVLENLLRNAVQHSGEDVTVRVGLVEDGFYVEDDGPGIPPSERASVTAAGYTTADTGSGVGLRIVSEALSQRDWELTIADAHGLDPADTQGARFEITGCSLIDRLPSLTPGDAIALDAAEDIGQAQTPGSASYDEEIDEWTITGAGDNLWGNTNESHFVYATTDTPVRIQAQFLSFDPLADYSKVGLMLRGSLAEDSPYTFLGQTGNGESEVIWRSSPGRRGLKHPYPEPLDVFPWYRLDCVDGEITGYVSTDGQQWDPISQRSIEIEGRVHVGLTICSLDCTETSTARLGDVRVFDLNESQR